MKRFEFRLEAVLRFYEMQLDVEKAKLARALAEEQELVASIAQRTEEMRQQNEAIRALVELRSGDIRSLSSYNLSAQAQNIAACEKLARVRRAIDMQRQAVLRQGRKTKLLAKLKQRKFAEWQKIMDRRLETESQEIWLAVNGRSRSAPRQGSDPTPYLAPE